MPAPPSAFFDAAAATIIDDLEACKELPRLYSADTLPGVRVRAID